MSNPSASRMAACALACAAIVTLLPTLAAQSAAPPQTETLASPLESLGMDASTGLPLFAPRGDAVTALAVSAPTAGMIASVVGLAVFGFLLLGIIIGFWVGLLPGIGGLSTLALMLPFSYSIKEPIAAFAFLLGMLAVTGTTGDLTAILFGIPGEGSSAALILDGYPLSKNGEAGRALGAAIMT